MVYIQLAEFLQNFDILLILILIYEIFNSAGWIQLKFELYDSQAPMILKIIYCSYLANWIFNIYGIQPADFSGSL